MKEKNKKNNKELTAVDAIKKSQEESLIPKPVTVGTLRKENTSPIGIIIFFGILIAVALFLPKITDYFNNEKESVNVPSVTSSTEEKNDEVENLSNTEEINYFEISDSDITINDNLMIKNMNIKTIDGENFINFDIYNLSNITLSNKDNYFLELYDSNKSFIERIKVGKLNLESKKTINKSLEISSNAKNSAKLFLFNSLNTKNYPNFELEYKNSLKATLVCTKNNDTLSYSFIKDKLQTIKEEVSITNTEKNYNSLLKEYQEKYQKYLKIDNIETNFTNNTNDFTYDALIDLKKVDYKLLDDERFYKIDTLVNIVKYEMEALQYKCLQGE